MLAGKLLQSLKVDWVELIELMPYLLNQAPLKSSDFLASSLPSLQAFQPTLFSNLIN